MLIDPGPRRKKCLAYCGDDRCDCESNPRYWTGYWPVMVDDPVPQAVAPTQEKPVGVYIASRASLQERAANWRMLRDVGGWNIISSWIDEAGEGQTSDFSELWLRIENEIRHAERLILYVEPGDFPIKGALIEVGMALVLGVPVYVVAPGVHLEERSGRPLGSWIHHPRVVMRNSMADALDGAARRKTG